MTELDWRAEMALQNAYLRAQLDALRSGPKSRWRKFRLYEVVCGSCADILLEVMDTEPYPVVFSRGLVTSNAEAAWGEAPTVADRVAASGQRLRRGERSWFPINKPVPAADSEEARCGLVFTVCRCRQVTLPLGPIFEALRRGERRRVLHAGSVPQ